MSTTLKAWSEISKIPQVDAQVVCCDEGRLVAAERYAVHMVCVRVGILLLASCCQDNLCAGHLQVCADVNGSALAV